MSAVFFKIKGAHFYQKSDLEGLIPKEQAPAPHHIIFIWHGADKDFEASSIEGEVCDLVIWISNDFVSCKPVNVSGVTVSIWKCSTVTLLRHFAQLRDHLQKQIKGNWSPTAWIKDLELLRVLDILIQGYQLTHPNDQTQKKSRFAETTLAYLQARGGEMESPSWWVTGLGNPSAGTLKEALQHEAETAGVTSLNPFYDFLEGKKDADFFSYINGIRADIRNALPR